MKKHLMIVLLAASLAVTISGCQKQETEETVGIMAETEENLEGMALYSYCPFVYEDSEWELQTFVREDMLIDGELAMDDSGHFLIQAILGEESYVFLDETIQLGVPDFVFDSEEKTFIGTDVLSGEGINYMGTTGK